MLNNSNLYGSEWLALVFSNRNQNYGAYVLRAQASNTLLKALFIVAPLFIMLFVGPMIYAQWHKDELQPVLYDHPIDIAPEPIHEMEPKKELPKNEPQAKSLPKTKLSTVNLSHPTVVENTLDVPPTMKQVQESVVGSVTQIGDPGVNDAPPAAKTGGAGGTSNEGIDVNAVYDQYGVEAFPEFPGGMEAWAKFIQKNLRYPYAAQDATVQGKVFISFVIERDGSISDVKVIKGIGFGCDDEAVRVIKKSPRWKPGMQNKQSVRVRYNMPINYTLSN